MIARKRGKAGAGRAGTSVQSSRGLTVRTVAALAMAAAMAVLVAACSLGASYPTILDIPAPRADTPMNADEVKQATDSLISDRDQLSAETRAGDPKPSQSAASPANNAKKLAKKKPASPASQSAAAAPAAAPGGATQTAGADVKQ
jgi:hypothetical protein